MSCAGVVAVSWRWGAAGRAPRRRRTAPASGRPWIVSVGDSAISGEAGPLGGQHQRLELDDVDALGSTAYYDNATNRRADPRLPPLASRPRCTSAAASTAEPRVLRRAHLHADAGRRRLQARARLLLATRGRQGQALDAAAVRGDAQRARPSRCSSAPTTSASPTSCRRCIDDWLMSPSWWKNYCNDDSSVNASFTAARHRDADHEHQGRDPATCARRCSTPATPTAQYKIIVQTYSSPIPNGSGFRYSQIGLHAPDRPAAAASGTATPTGPTTPSSRRSTTRCATAPRRPGSRNVDDPRRPERARRAAAVREHGRAARGEGRRIWTERRRGRQDRVGQPDPHDVRRSSVRTSSRRTAHPSYWGQLALRNCLRQAYNGARPAGATMTCVRGNGLNGSAEPNMALQ